VLGARPSPAPPPHLAPAGHPGTTQRI
jgi:hypothetical protein